jgi:hypothetical protein
MTESNKPGIHDDAEPQTLSAPEKPALDEETFQQLLEAAHVLQEMKGAEPAVRPEPVARPEAAVRRKPDPTEALAEIVATQEFLRSQPCDLDTTANLVVEQLRKITNATGVAVALMRENQLKYCAATGDAAHLVGSQLAMDASLSPEGQVSTKFSREHPGENSMALSLLHEGKLAGLLEVRFADSNSIPEPEMRSCQLLAGLMTEAIARSSDQEWRQTLAAERAAMLEALERIKPQLERLAVEPATQAVESGSSVVAPAVDFPQMKDDGRSQKKTMQPAAETAEYAADVPHSNELRARSRAAAICAQCGYQFGEHELFCGRCGTARPVESAPSGDLQSKWASMWHMQQAEENRQREVGEKDSEEKETGNTALTAFTNSGGLFSPELSSEASPEFSPELEKMLAQFSHQAEEEETPREKETETGLAIGGLAGEDPTVVPAAVAEPLPPSSAWGSASNARKWLESLDPRSPAGIWLAKHRADIYVGAAIILLLLAWGIRSPENHTQSKNPPQPSLTFYEKMMVSLGLAETPAVPVYLGNPNAQVWVDLHTALYYCSNSELYGKTSGGKYTTQRDAQMDQFEPAARKNCD